MKLGVMQPYAFPYLGYYQLIHAVDLFILYDDVAFPKQGWVNRNFLGTPCGSQRFTMPVRKPKLGQTILDTWLHEREAGRRRFLKTIQNVYARAPYYEPVRAVIEEATGYAEDCLADFLCHSILAVNNYLGINTPLLRSSRIFGHIKGAAAERIIQICNAAGADTYVNAEGGLQLYSQALFRKHCLELRFLVHEPRPYRQNCREFLPRLSIIDVMMFNSRQRIAELLHDYQLISDPKGEDNG